MKIEGVTLYHFSPLGKTKETLMRIAEGIGYDNIQEVDYSRFDERWQKRSVPSGQLAVFGFPVYSGRLPQVAKEIFHHLKAAGTPAIAVVVFGNREFDDALLELKDNLDKVGFTTVAAGAFVAEHAMNPNAGAGRPDASDIAKQIEFGRQARLKLDGADVLANAAVSVPGNFPYRNQNDIPVAPSLNGPCTNCGSCIRNCPVAAIDPNNSAKTDSFRCILCMRCVRICPEKSRTVTHEKFSLFMEMLPLITSQRKEPTLII